ncbi:MAG: slipin family protein [Flavobacteriales bacterium]|nr:slipin family protein [Flavobacteriales bacterium]
MKKRIKVNKGQVALVFKNNEFTKVLQPGKYWVTIGSDVYTYALNEAFHTPIDLDVLLENKEVADLIDIIEVADQEIALVYENKNFRYVLNAGRHTFWKASKKFSFQIADLSKIEIPKGISKNTLVQTELLPYIRVFSVESYEKGLMFVNGEFEKKLKSGIYYFWKNAEAIVIQKVDVRLQNLEVVGQEILTKDKAALRMNFTIQYKVVDIEKALINNNDFQKQLYVMAQLALREYVGALTLDELLDSKESVVEAVYKTLKEKVNSLGVSLLDCGIKDIILPGEVKDIMKQVLVAQKQAQANIITRREETASTRSLLNTAKLMEDNEMLFKLKEMEYIEKIADKISSITVNGNSQVVDQLKTIFTGKNDD